MLKTVTLHFYQSEDVLQAKWLLTDDTSELYFDKMPCIFDVEMVGAVLYVI